ncbi:MAG: GDP-mannose 4,6-dehydratase [Phycisphaerae bacterium]|nr:GDP-mannose 4,6-dehydratase [Saprospiraceae bacterium]
MPTNRITPVSQALGDVHTVFITGGAGFIGSHTVDFFLRKGRRVVAIDDLSTGCLDNLDEAFAFPNFSFIEENVSNVDWLGLLDRHDTVVHLAASVGVKKVCESALVTAHNNHVPVEMILNAMREKGGGRFLYASSSEVYGDSPLIGSSESDFLQVHTHLGGRSAYTVSKLYGELIALAYAEAHQIPVTVMRFFNTIGTRQRSEYGMVVPIFVQQALLSEPITVYGDGTQTRSFCDVGDLAGAIFSLSASSHSAGKIYNLGNPEEISIYELAQFVKAETGSNSPIHLLQFPPERADDTDIRRRKPNIARIESEIGWRPRIHWKQSVRNIIRETAYIAPVLQAEKHAQRFHH